MLTVTDGERIHKGSPLEIVAGLREQKRLGFDGTDDEFITHLAQQAWRWNQKSVDPGTGSTAERAERLVRGLIEAGMLTEIKGDGRNG